MTTSRRPAPAEEPFILTAMLSLLAASLWLALRSDLLLQFYYSPELLALTHLLTLGFITSVIMGVLLRLAPVALDTPPRSRRAALVQYGLFLTGGSGMVIHFARAHWVGLAWATLLVGAAALVQLWNFWGLWRRAAQGDMPALHAAAALCHLVLAASLGASFGMLKAHGWGGGWLDAPLLDRIAAHLHLAALGWVTTMIFGLQHKLLPATAGPARWQPLRFALLQCGLLGSVACLLFGWPGRAVFAALVLAAILWQAAGPLRQIRKQRTSFGEITALIVLTALGGTGLALALDVPDPASPLRLRVQFAYGFTALFGWVVLTFSSTAFKLFPMWVWQERFELKMGKAPPLTALFSQRLRDLTGLLLALGVIGTAAGIVAESELLTSAAPWVLFAGVAGLAANFASTASWALLKRRYPG